MKGFNESRESRRGVALMTAITLLAIFLFLGMVWVTEMANDNEATDLVVGEARARHLATAGVNAVIGDLSAAIVSGGVDPGQLGERQYQFPIYGRAGGTHEIQIDTGLLSKVSVTISDENAKINLNHAPPKVLRSMLGVDGDTARAIRASLPLPGIAPSAQHRWFTSVDELVTRGFLTPEQLDRVDENLVTVYTVPDANVPRGFINVNSAPLAVIQAVLDLEVAQAERVVAARPFFTLDELVASAGKQATLFNTRPPDSENEGLPPELTFQSRCFRIAAESEIFKSVPGLGTINVSRARTEAVVYFEADGGPRVQYWSEAPSRVQ